MEKASVFILSSRSFSALCVFKFLLASVRRKKSFYVMALTGGSKVGCGISTWARRDNGHVILG